jgi:hypothetical protein
MLPYVRDLDDHQCPLENRQTAKEDRYERKNQRIPTPEVMQLG